MKKLIYFLVSIILFFLSCKKNDNAGKHGITPIKTCKCCNSYNSSDSVICEGNLCKSDTCKTYLAIWKDLFISRNQLTQQYFDEHVIPCGTQLSKWQDGISFEVYYKITIKWAETRLYDNFIIWISPTNNTFPSLNLPRNVLLSEDQINSAIGDMAFGSSMNKISLTDNLKFTSKKAAIATMIKASNVDTLCNFEVEYKYTNMVMTSNGHPYLKAYNEIDIGSNKCLSSEMDLVTGDVETIQYPCIIYFCFSSGTQITMKNNLVKPIEKLREGDTILSVNMKSMIVEEDIVQQINSPKHNNLIKLIFSDSTTIFNTSDHPYFVKGKGWCSFKPKETLQKYKLNTKQLEEGDMCLKFLNSKLREVQLKSIIEIKGEFQTYNLTLLKKNNNYFANGILVGNEGK